MEALADIAERYSFDEARVSHEQNLVLPHVRLDDIPALFAALDAVGLGTSNAGLVTDIIACPGLDYCALANARSIPVASRLSERFGSDARQAEIGPLSIKISGCINACGHHHVGHIGILGVDKQGAEFYQVSIGGAQGNAASLGKVIGPSFAQDDVPDVIERLIQTYLACRDSEEERFIDVVRRIGIEPFKESVYGNAHQKREHHHRQLAAA
jgi:sulfite reductase (NADPH) hemoprotein beta-component